MNNILNSNKFSYDFQGIKSFCAELREKNPKHLDMIEELEPWMLKNI